MKKEDYDFKEQGLILGYMFLVFGVSTITFSWVIMKFNEFVVIPMFNTGTISYKFSIGVYVIVLCLRALFIKSPLRKGDIKIEDVTENLKKTLAIALFILSIGWATSLLF